MRTRRTAVVIVAVIGLLATGCGGDSIGGGAGGGGANPLDDSPEQIEDALGDVLSGGGGGLLVFDGQEIPIDAVTCVLDADTFDVGTVSDNGFRVFVSRNNPANDVAAQVLDPDFLQWFPQGGGDEAERAGGTFTSETRPYFNNSDDRIVDVSFTIECP